MWAASTANTFVSKLKYIMLKFSFLIRRLPEMSREEFISYHKNNHAPLFSSIPETETYVKKYTVSHQEEIDGFPHPLYDGVTDIYFNSLEDFNTFFASKNYIEKVHPDESNFIDLENVVVLVSKETIIK